jgi:ribose 5-phosphate isomerase B
MTKRWRVAIGGDIAGQGYKDMIRKDLEADDRVAEVIDVGVDDDTAKTTRYPNVAFAVASRIVEGEADRGILICGTGIGMQISANKVKGIWATVAHDSYSVERSVMSNNCQVLTMGQRVIGPELARRLVKEWLGYEFDPSSHSKDNVDVIEEYEAEH